ncbi:MAG: AAA family ATPase, partial [bacterium]
MLTELRIRNFAIIESLTLPLGRGFNVLSGETGAGKSIIVGALGLLLGERASPDLIRTGADRATVEGVFDVSDRPEIVALLDERGIDADEPLVVLKREIAAAGRARAWVNGTTVSAAILADVGRMLVNLHGQHEAQTLLDGEAQRRILDAFAGATEHASAVRDSYAALATARRDIADLRRRRADAEKRADYLRHVVGEIEGAKLVEGEDVRLEDEARRLENAEELRELATGISTAIEGDEDSLLQRLASVERLLASIQRIDPTLARLQEIYDNAYYSLEALPRELDEYESSVELDPARLDEVRRRRDLLFKLTKKYGSTLAEVVEQGRAARAELD